jgi:hypothetical protein
MLNQSENNMNIFILDNTPQLAAQYHCDKHVVKMVLESAQMLCTAINEEIGTPITPYKSTHKNHPCTKWVSASRHNALWLYNLMECLGEEYTHRYGKQHLTIEKMRIARIKELANLILPDVPLTEFAQAMPDYCKTQTDAVSAYRSYYLNEKRDLLKYTKRNLPYWAEG